MRLSGGSLGVKLNLALLFFFIILGGLTAAFILYGFNRTQDNATASSQEGLEDFGSKTLGAFARLVGGQVGFWFARASQSSELAAHYLPGAIENVEPVWDSSVLVAGEGGALYDPSEDRLADFWLPNFLQASEASRRRLEVAAYLAPLFPGMLQSVPEATAVYFAGVDGEFVYYPPIGIHEIFDAGTRVWSEDYRAALPENNPERKTVWVPPYDDLLKQGKLVSVATPVYLDDEFLGIVGFDISLDAFIVQVDSIHPTRNGYSFYVDSTGEFLATMHSTAVEASLTDNEGLGAALASMDNGEFGQVTTRIDDTDVVVAFAPIEGIGGSLALVGPVADLLEEAQAAAVASSIEDEGGRTLRVTLLAMCGLFVIGLMGATYLNRRVLIRPIEALVSATRAVAQGNFDTRIAVSGNDELAELGHSFNAMSVEVMASRGDLERQVEERTQELTTLLVVSQNVASTLELKPLLSLVIEEVQAIAGFSRGSVLTAEGESFVILHSQSAFGDASISARFPMSSLEPISSRVMAGEAIIIPDVRADTPEAEAYRRVTEGLFTTAYDNVRSWMVVPLSLKDRVVGFLSLAHTLPDFYTDHHASLVSAIATQIAVAIENARLYEQAQQLAAVEERQRLARELHDSVSQALYGIALGARTARTLLDTDAARATEPVDYVLQLAEAGLAEMRALIFELRPESLESEGLVAALEKQIAATRARYGLDVQFRSPDEPSMNLQQKEVFYRVAQEALHNVVKHARATRVDVRLVEEAGLVTLEVRDNGIGFDSAASFPGHMGLVSFRERTSSIGATLAVESAPGAGTSVRLAVAALLVQPAST